MVIRNKQFRPPVHQERLFQEYSLSRVESQLKQMEKILSQQTQSRELELNGMRGEIASLKRVTDEYKRKYSEVSERLMERNRQYQKLQGLYDSLRLRNMVVGGERESGGGMMRDVPPGLDRPMNPRPSPQLYGTRGEGDRFFSLEPDGPKTFFQFSSPDRGHSLVPKK
ncbi:E3 ubiquitin-protein ligase CCNB1IP1 isoform X2 [Sardina pilchardus]|uniref:E3 ubiquitin-protein ligase CCNB1IP1 isoform X2 n=1 Tax=Sardina pilchardus TaxID=27697 RepID=UPI002E1393AC